MKLLYTLLLAALFLHVSAIRVPRSLIGLPEGPKLDTCRRICKSKRLRKEFSENENHCVVKCMEHLRYQ
ncbi:unnamed protein product [Cylicocyclus nassatus]|uniref:Uncharacterized protein n=1 Tax=Cylicocyclus nassatus TaxID=53992 RepID=A0AA36DP89_CYLNA|nr:unnamed protein product [Cylicocyclus nassatus]